MLLVMRMTFLLSMISLMQISASVYSQAKKISLNLESVTVGEIIDEIKEQSEFNFLYRSDLFDEIAPIDIKFVNTSIEDILDEVLVLNGFEYEIDDNVVIIRKEKETVPEMVTKEETKRTITGKVTEKNGMPMVGVNILVKGTTIGTISDIEGNYEIEVPEDARIFVFS